MSKKSKFSIFVAVAAVFAILTNLFVFNITVHAANLPVYLSLGDSIAAGYGLTGKDEGYAYLLSKNRYELSDFAVPGYDSADLLKQLSDTTNKNLQSALSSASLITVSIGGNNFLKPLSEIFAALNTDELMNSIPDSVKNNPSSVSSADISSLMTVINSINKYFTPGTSEYVGLTSALDKGFEQFVSDLDKIINILGKNKDAKIVFLTVYNPYKGFGSSYFKEFESMCELYIGKLNKTITDKSNSNGKYLVSDIYSAFKNSTQKVVNADALSMNMNMDPHPNAAGHKLLYKTIAHSLGFSVYFDDMAGDPWAVEYVDSLNELGIIFGTNTQKKEFSPKAELKNCDLAVLLVRTLKLKITDADVSDVNLPFSDTNKIDSYALNSVKACYKAGLYNQLYPNSSGKTYEFAPQKAAKRIDVALMAAQIIDKSKWSNKKPVYTDLKGVDESYYPALSTLYEYGIMTGSPDKTLDPFGSLTRAQVAKILYSILNNPQLVK